MSKKEVRNADMEMTGIIEGGLATYKEALKAILQNDMEDLYGGGRNEPKCTEENEDAVLEIWNNAVEACIKKVKEL